MPSNINKLRVTIFFLYFFAVRICAFINDFIGDTVVGKFEFNSQNHHRK